MCLRVIRDHRYHGSIVSLEITIMNPNMSLKLNFKLNLTLNLNVNLSLKIELEKVALHFRVVDAMLSITAKHADI